MASFKTIVCMCLFVAVATAVEIKAGVRSDQHNIDECTDDEGLLLHKTVIAEPHFWQIQEQTLHFPEGSIPNKAVITCVRVYDQIGNGNGGYPVITDGGLNFKFVTIRFTSQRSHGFQFIVSVYGKE